MKMVRFGHHLSLDSPLKTLTLVEPAITQLFIYSPLPFSRFIQILFLTCTKIKEFNKQISFNFQKSGYILFLSLYLCLHNFFWLWLLRVLIEYFQNLMLPFAAIKALEVGAAGIIVSNHGARQLDYCPPTISVLEEVPSLHNCSC